MKKIQLLPILFVFLLIGCGPMTTETMTCSYETVRNNVTTKTNYMIDHQGDEVKKLRITYKYHQEVINDTDGDGKNDIDGVGTGTDGTTNDTQIDNDGIIDGIVGSAIDTVINGVTDVILDVAGIRDRHATVQGKYGNITGFSVQNTNDSTDNDYTVTYVIDYDTISNDDLATLNLSRNINTLRDNYISQGFTCK